MINIIDIPEREEIEYMKREKSGEIIKIKPTQEYLTKDELLNIINELDFELVYGFRLQIIRGFKVYNEDDGPIPITRSLIVEDY